jgi:hypothetical protein
MPTYEMPVTFPGYNDNQFIEKLQEVGMVIPGFLTHTFVLEEINKEEAVKTAALALDEFYNTTNSQHPFGASVPLVENTLIRSHRKL